MFRLDLQAVS